MENAAGPWRKRLASILPPFIALARRTGIELFPEKEVPVPRVKERPRIIRTDTNELTYDLERENEGIFMVDTKGTKVISGFVRGRRFDLSGVKVEFLKTLKGWATFTMTSLNGNDLLSAKRILIAATGMKKNKGWNLERLGRNRVTLRDRWGSPPVLCEGIKARISFPARTSPVAAFPLGPEGNRSGSLEIGRKNGKYFIEIPGTSLWYMVTFR